MALLKKKRSLNSILAATLPDSTPSNFLVGAQQKQCVSFLRETPLGQTDTQHFQRVSTSEDKLGRICADLDYSCDICLLPTVPKSNIRNVDG